MRILRTLLPALALSVSPPALADQKEADTCLRTKIWSGYDDGWAVRTATSADLGEGQHRIYLVTLYAGHEYKFQVCGDKSVNNIDLVLHDEAGKELARDESNDREPKITFKPTATQTYYVAVYAADLSDESKVETAGVAMAVTYK